MKYLITSFFSVFLITATSGAVRSQTSTVDDSDFQSWNDVSVTKKMSDKIDLYFPFTLRLAGNARNFGEGKVGAGIVFHATKRITITPYFQRIRSRNAAGVYRNENRYIVNGVYKFPIEKVGLSHRSQFEFRDRASGNSWRYRPSVTIDKGLPEKWVKGLKVFATEEGFYDSSADRFSRNRFSTGIKKTLSKNLSLDLYYLRQDDSVSHPGTVHALGTGWKIKF